MITKVEQVVISQPENCVVKITYPDEGEITLELARRLTCELYRRYGFNLIGLVHVAGRDTTVGGGVREFLAGRPGTRSKIAEAFVVKNLNQRIQGNFYLRVGKPGCPSEVFTMEDEAVKWVKMYCPKKTENKNTGDDEASPPVQTFSAN